MSVAMRFRSNGADGIQTLICRFFVGHFHIFMDIVCCLPEKSIATVTFDDKYKDFSSIPFWFEFKFHFNCFAGLRNVFAWGFYLAGACQMPVKCVKLQFYQGALIFWPFYNNNISNGLQNYVAVLCHVNTSSCEHSLCGRTFLLLPEMRAL